VIIRPLISEEDVASPSPIRLLTFQPTEAQPVIDQALRSAVAGGGLIGSGQRRLIVGRRNADTVAERVIVSVWETATALEAWAGVAVRERELVPGIGACDLEVLPLEVRLDMDPGTEPAVLRIFRGTVREGELDSYVREARGGTLADVEAGRGPHALYLAVTPPTRFLTVSLWGDWSAIEQATGGDIRRPVATRHADRLTSGTARHYEIVADIPGPAPGRVAS
jgi:hypothetical protein